MDVLLLGPVELHDHHRTIRIIRRQERLLLAVLAVRAPRYVGVHQLVDLVWAAEPPARPVAAVQSMVAHLRAAVQEAGTDREVIASCGHGYAWQGSLDRIDLHRALRLSHAARATESHLTRLDLLADALSQWRGPSVIDVGDESVQRRVMGPHADLRQSIYQEWLAAHLPTDRYAQAVGPLSVLAARSPLSESIQTLLMSALHRAGRRPEALEVYRRTRHHLAAELGLDPSAALQAAQRRVLLDQPATPATGAPTPSP